MNENKSSIGPIIGTIIIIAIIILGGLYFWGKRIEETRATENLVSQTEPTDNSEASAITSVGSSDDLDSIQADLNGTQTENLSGELDATTAAQ